VTNTAKFEKAITEFGIKHALEYFATPKDKYHEFSSFNACEPKREFTWHTAGMWVLVSDNDSDWFVKTSYMGWDRIRCGKQGIPYICGSYTKQEIIENFKPGKPAPWADKISEDNDPDSEVEAAE